MANQGWMSDFVASILDGTDLQQLRLQDLSIPGTHHSSVNCMLGLNKLISPWAVCQTLSIGEQFDIGVRFFHVAVADDVCGNEVYVKHRFASKPILGQLLTLKEKLLQCPKQIIILYLKSDKYKLSQSGAARVMNLIEQHFGGQDIGILKKSYEAKHNLIDWHKSGKFPGRVVLSGLKGFDPDISKEYVWACPNSYKKTKSNQGDEVCKKMVEFLQEQHQKSIVEPDKMGNYQSPPNFMNYECIVTLNCQSILAEGNTIWKQTNRLRALLHSQLFQDKLFKKYANIVMLDHIQSHTASTIINLNYKRWISQSRKSLAQTSDQLDQTKK